MGYPCHTEANSHPHTLFFLSLLSAFPLPPGLSKSRAPELKKKGPEKEKNVVSPPSSPCGPVTARCFASFSAGQGFRGPG